MSAPILSKDLLSWEPVKMLTSMKQLCSNAPTIATLELSTLDMLYDYYNSVLLFYDVGHVRMSLQNLPVPQEVYVDTATAAASEPVLRLQHALEEMLAHYPCAAGSLVYNEKAGRLEVRYPMYARNGTQPQISCSGTGHVNTPLSNINGANDAAHEVPSYGLHFYVAHADITLADLGDVSIPQPSLDVLYPSKPTQRLDRKGNPLPRFVMAFQVTTFKCGGFTLGHLCSHAYADGYTGAAFLQNLCSVARGEGLVNSLRMIPSRRAVISAREPPTPTMPYRFIQARKRTEQPEEKRLHYGTAIRFRFTVEALDALRVSASMPGQSKLCSRNRALMALLWAASARVSLKVHGLPGSHGMDLRFPMNIRTRGLSAGLSAGYMGNALCQIAVPATLQELCDNPLAYTVDKTKRTMETLDMGETLQSLVDYLELQVRDGLTPSIVGLGMPSLVGLPFYDTDCGWGLPTYVGRPSQQLSNRCIILEHPVARAWNVLVVFASSEEHACFQERIATYIT